MKKIVITIAGFVLLLAGSFAVAQMVSSEMKKMITDEDVRETILEKPETALKTAGMELKTALQEKNAPAVIDALIRRTVSQMLISRDSFPSLVNEIEKLALNSKNPVEQSVLYSLLGGLYYEYYNSNELTILNRPAVVNEVPRDMTEWSGNVFADTILFFNSQALHPVSYLQNTPVGQYRPVLKNDQVSSVFYPTMYDFVAMRTIGLYENISSLTEKYQKQQSIDEKLLWLPADEFIMQKFPSGEMQVESHILKIYQELLRFHGKDKLSASYIMSDLNRLSYVSSLSYGPEKYKRALERLLETTSGSPYSCEVVRELAMQYQYVDQSKNAATRKALDLCNEWISRYPGYERIGCLKEVRKNILSSHIEISIPEIIYPGTETILKVTYRNVGDVNFSLYRRDGISPQLNYSFDFQKPDDKDILLSKTENWRNADSLINQNTEFKLPPLQTGVYIFRIKTGNEDVVRSVVVSRLMSVFRNINGSGNIYVTDSRTGRPLEGVSVNLYTQRRDSLTRPAETLITDKNGMVSVSNKAYRIYQLSLKGDSLSPARNFYLYKNNDINTDVSSVSLFTDRSVYRPGQTVYYSAVAWVASEKVRKVLPDQKYKMSFYDASGSVISTLEKETDEFGSFSGSFVIPRDVMNGYFRIEAGNKSSVGFQVAQYKRPQFQIIFNPLKELYSFGKKITLKGEARTYSGVAVADSKLTYTVTRKPNWWYRFLIPGKANEQIANGALNTSADGSFSVSFVPEKGKTDIERTNVAYNYEVRVSVTSASGETQDAVYTIPVGDTPLVVNVEINGIINKEIPVPFDVKLQNLSGQPVYQNCKYVLYTLYDKPLEKGSDTTGSLDSLKVKMQVAEGEFNLPDKPKTMNWGKLPSGPYKLVVMTKDENGRLVTGESRFILYGKQDKRPPMSSYLWVPETEMSVKEGGTAEVVFGSSCKNAYLIYEIYDGMQLIHRQQVKLSDKNQKLSIPYKRSYSSELSVYVMMVMNGKIYNQMIRIKRQEPSNELTISTSTFRDKLMPGAVEKWSFHVRDAKGKPVSARFMAEMYDASLNAINTHEWTFMPVVNSGQLWIYPAYSGRGLDRIDVYYNNDTVKYPCTFIRPYRLNMYDIPLFGGYYNLRMLSKGGALKESSSSVADMAAVPAMAGSGMKLMENAVAEQENKDVDAGHSSVYRENMNETAFFYPLLRTDSTGDVSFEFTVPESNTEWDFLSLAYTKDLQFGNYKNSAVSNKPLMVAPNMPRFVRQGDEVTIGNYVQNISESLMEGRVTFELFDPYTEKIVLTSSEPFILKGKESKNVNLKFSVPENAELLGYRVKAVTSLYSDGEQQLLPVLPSRIMITESQPFYIGAGDKNTGVTMPGMTEGMRSASLQSYRLTLEYCDNPVWYVVQALPALTEPENDDAVSIMASYFTNTVAEGIIQANPRIEAAIKSWKASPDKETLISMLNKNEELKNILLSETPWVLEATTETARMQQLSTLLDRNRIRDLQNAATRKLQILQSYDGGWSWFKGMSPGAFTTLNVLDGFSRLSKMGMVEYGEDIKQMQIKAINFIDGQMVKQRKDGLDKSPLSYIQICYLYVRSQYRDIPLAGDILPVHKRMTERLSQEWNNYSLTEKAYAAMALYNYGFVDVAHRIVNSLREYSTTTAKMGMFWQNNRSSYYFQNGAVQMNCAIYDAFKEISPVKEELDNMRKWLLMQKQTQEWASVPATMDAIYFLLKEGTDWLQADAGPVSVIWGGKVLDTREPSALTGYEKYVKTAPEINVADAKVEIRTNKEQPSWGALYWQYFDDMKNVTKKAGEDISVAKQLFVQRTTATGTVSVPINEAGLRVGDRVAVQLTVKCSRDLDFVCLKDQRAACLEPVEQLSSYQYSQKVGYYKEVKDATVNYFFDFLPKGTYVLNYVTNVERAGEYENGISSMQCLYAPQINAHTQGGEIIVK